MILPFAQFLYLRSARHKICDRCELSVGYQRGSVCALILDRNALKVQDSKGTTTTIARRMRLALGLLRYLNRGLVKLKSTVSAPL